MMKNIRKPPTFIKNLFTIILKSESILMMICLIPCVSHLWKLGIEGRRKTLLIHKALAHILMLTCAGLVSEATSSDTEI